MKKVIGGVLLGLIIMPSVVFGQVKPVDISADDSNVWDVLIVLIVQLTRQITELQAQIDILKSEVAYYKALSQPLGGQSQAPSPAPVVTPIPAVSPAAPVAPRDVVAPILTLFSIDQLGQRAAPPVDVGAPAGFYLRVTANEPLNFQSTVLPEGVQLGQVTYNGKEEVFKNKTSYYYEALLVGVVGDRVQVGVKDLAGHVVEKSVQVWR